MKDGFLKVGAATPKCKVADPRYNVEQHIAAAEEAAAAGVKVLVFPELSITAYTCADLFFQQALIAAAAEALVRYIRRTRDLDLLSLVGVPVAAGDKLYNCAAVIKGGVLLGLVPKTNLPNHGESCETRWFAPAPAENITVFFDGEEVVLGSKQIFACQGMPALRLAAELGEDLWVPVPPSCGHVAAGATVIANLSASCEMVGKPSYRENLLRMTSARSICAYLYADAGEGESGTDLVFSAANAIAENGKLLASAEPFSGQPLTTAVLDLGKLTAERRRSTTFPQTCDSQYRTAWFALETVETDPAPAPRYPFVPEDESEREARCELIFQIQSAGLAGRMERAHASGAVLGISGGLDSTLALLVAVRAAEKCGMPMESIVAITMPCFGTTARTRGNAEKLCEELGVTLRCIDIHESVRCHFRDIGHDENNHDTTYENSQARERTQILMDVANQTGGLVVGTGDLSELALGWATYNGDHMSMYAVNADVPKTLVRYLVDYRADEAEKAGQHGLAGVLRDILNTPVSPELLPPKEGEIAQCTEGIVGPYALHDFFMYYMVRFGYTPTKIYRMACSSFRGEYEEDVIASWLKIFLRRFFTQQFKRSCLPDGPKVGSVGFSPRGDWRMPSDASFTEWQSWM